MKKIAILALCMFMATTFAACGEKAGETPPANNGTTDNPPPTETPSGAAFDHKYISGELPNGWIFYPDPKNDIFAWIKTPDDRKMISFSFVWQNTTDAKTQTEKFVKDYADMKPTPAMPETYGKYEYWTTSYENAGYKIKQLVTMEGEIMVTVGLTGDIVINDPEVPAILGKLAYKNAKPGN